jgi:ubiquinone/menaquinone biosynthesis C-methylase UbiE
MLRLGINPVVMTDFSPRVLKRNRTYFSRLGLYDALSLVASDARRLPFRDDSVSTLTSYLGLPNIRKPGEVLQELRRIGDGVFWTISQFYREDDEAHQNFIQEQGFELLYEKVALDRFEEAGWQVNILNRYRVEVAPTPESDVLVGARIDRMPLSKTEIDICLLRATSL